MRKTLCLLAALASFPAFADAWYVLSREDGCLPIFVLFRKSPPTRIPASPEEYAQLLRRQGKPAQVGPVPGFPPEMAGKAVQVKAGEDHAPVFVREEICRGMEKGR